MGIFTFEIKGSDLYIEVEGMMTEKDGIEYVNTYKNIVASMPIRDKIILKCIGLQVTSQDLIGMLEDCFRMYKEDFKTCKIIIKKDENFVLKMQINRLSNNTQLDVILEEI